jgi:peptidoglycan hydrolase-like protein with peptidoglycan-binding domain
VQPTPATPSPARSVDGGGFVLPVTEALRALPADQETERTLELDRATGAALQTRLKLAGFDPGGADGSFGKRSRKAIQDWQSSRGLMPTGYLNQSQYELIVNQTETAFASYVPPVEAARPESKRRTSSADPNRQRRTEQRRTEQRRTNQGGQGAENVGRFVGGVIGGLLRN